MVSPHDGDHPRRALRGAAVVTMLSARLSQAIAKGRHAPPPATRPDLLVALLRKRAAAHVRGDVELEALLRAQIRWALPMQRGEAVG